MQFLALTSTYLSKVQISACSKESKGEYLIVTANVEVAEFLAAGLWLPEMKELAGGDCPLQQSGDQPVRISWEEVLPISFAAVI